MSDSSTKASNASVSRDSRDSRPPWSCESRDRRFEASYIACDISWRSSSSSRFWRFSMAQLVLMRAAPRSGGRCGEKHPAPQGSRDAGPGLVSCAEKAGVVQLGGLDGEVGDE